MKLLQAPNLERIALTKVMYTAIHSYDEQAFDNMSEESEEKNFIVKKSLRPVPSRGLVEQAKKHGGFRITLTITQKNPTLITIIGMQNQSWCQSHPMLACLYIYRY